MILRANEKEKIVSAEKQRVHKSAESVEAGLTLAQVERTVKQREQMLIGIERYLRVSTRQQLREKLAREQQALANIVEREKEKRAVAKKNLHVLSKAYFTQRPLAINMFE